MVSVEAVSKFIKVSGGLTMKTTQKMAALMAVGMMAGTVLGKVHTETVVYSAGETSLQGYLAY